MRTNPIPIKNRARKEEGSPSFRKSGKTRLVIGRGPNKREIEVGSYIAEDKSLVVNFSSKGTGIGSFHAKKAGQNSWTIYHRFIAQSYRGYYLGRVGFRYIEDVVRKNGGTKLSVPTNQPDVIQTLIKLGYSFDALSKLDIRKKLGLPKEDPFPDKKTLLTNKELFENNEVFRLTKKL